MRNWNWFIITKVRRKEENMRLKKIICIMATCVLSLGMLAGCGSSTSTSSTGSTTTVNNNSTKAAESSTATGSTTSVSAAGDKTQTGSGKTLVVYYSATGSTRKVAEEIASELGADTFEITPVQAYTSDDLNWNNNNSRVSKEHNDESLRNVELTKVTPDNWPSYDTVLIGYPIWWYIAAWPVNNFVKGNDFTGKTVIPFCTSASSGLGESGSLLQKMAGTGDWKDGHRFSSGASSSEVSKWVKSLNISK